jgi:hypothetical protein
LKVKSPHSFFSQLRHYTVCACWRHPYPSINLILSLFSPPPTLQVYFVPEEQVDTDDQYKHWPHVQVPVREDGGGQVVLDRDSHNIQPERKYRFRVTASNELSEGPPSPVQIV